MSAKNNRKSSPVRSDSLAVSRLWMLAAASLALFAVVAFLGRSGATEFDRTVLRALRSGEQALGPAWMVEVARSITALGGHTLLLLIVAIVGGYLAIIKQRATALFVIASATTGMLLNSAFKALFNRSRPDVVSHLTEVFTASFPSGHATLSAAVYLTLGALLAGIHTSYALRAYFIGIAVFLTIAIGLSRIYLGVHYPTDVLAGWCFGTSWAALCLAVFQKLQRDHTMEPPERP